MDKSLDEMMAERRKPKSAAVASTHSNNRGRAGKPLPSRSNFRPEAQRSFGIRTGPIRQSQQNREMRRAAAGPYPNVIFHTRPGAKE